jgi:hypothetical protein
LSKSFVANIFRLLIHAGKRCAAQRILNIFESAFDKKKPHLSSDIGAFNNLNDLRITYGAI